MGGWVELTPIESAVVVVLRDDVRRLRHVGPIDLGVEQARAMLDDALRRGTLPPAASAIADRVDAEVVPKRTRRRARCTGYRPSTWT